MNESKNRWVVLCQQVLVVAVVGAVALPASGVVSLDIVSPNEPSVSGTPTTDLRGTEASLVAAAPVEPTVREVPLASPAPLITSDPRVADRGVRRQARSVPAVAISQPTSVAGYATVGVTWDPDSNIREGDITFSVRTKREGDWSGWEPITYHDQHAPDAGEELADDRPGTEAFVIGDTEGVQVRAQMLKGGALPADMRVALIDPGLTEAVAVERPAIDTAALASATTDPDTGSDTGSEDAIEPVANPDVTPKPQIFSRAQWGADEKMRDAGSLSYGEVHAGFVHHTVNANGYTRKQVPSIIRGIYAYHTQSRGWSDVGYNFLVDRFGRIWEGRAGGVDRPVIGAHTLGYNENSFAMSAIGNFDIAQPSAAMIDAYGRLFAWKLSLHGISAASTRQTVGSRTFAAINGHRDAGSTACPGRYLYAKLGAIRTLAASYQRPFAARDLDKQLSGTTWPDLAIRDSDSGVVSVVRTGGQVRFLGSKRLASGWKGMDLIATPGDVTKDGYADVVARNRSTGVTSVYPATPSGALGSPIKATSAFAGYDLLIGVGDLNRDGRADLVGRDRASKTLYLVPGRAAAGAFGKPVRLASGWNYTLTAGVGDFDRDRRPDLVARDSAGKLFLFSGTADGRLAPSRQIASGTNKYDVIAGGGDVTGDGQADLLVRKASGGLTRAYAGDGSGGLGASFGPWTRMTKVSRMTIGGQFVGGAAHDLVAVTGAGNLVAFPNSGGEGVESLSRTNVTLNGHNLLLNAGDWDGDGHGDLITRTSGGNLQLRRGSGGNNFAGPTRLASGWSGLRQVAVVGDVTGDGLPDLMAKVGDAGAFRIYPGRGAQGLGTSFVAYSGDESSRQLAGGLYTGDGAPDTFTTRRDGSLWLYPGNGPGGMTRPTKVDSGLGKFDWIVGSGDLDGDRKNDLIARRKATGALVMIPRRGTGFGTPMLIATGYGNYDLSG